jgi:hypothetical protein
MIQLIVAAVELLLHIFSSELVTPEQLRDSWLVC